MCAEEFPLVELDGGHDARCAAGAAQCAAGLGAVEVQQQDVAVFVAWRPLL